MQQPYEAPAIVAVGDVVVATQSGSPPPGEGMIGLGVAGGVGFSL
jgi:hypothetical protein